MIESDILQVLYHWTTPQDLLIKNCFNEFIHISIEAMSSSRP